MNTPERFNQLVLNVDLPFATTFEYFYPGDNQHCCSALQAWLQSTHEDICFYLAGQPTSGRTHLLFACCHQMRTHNALCAYFSCHDLREAPKEVFQGLETMDFVALDDINALIGSRDAEEQCLYLYERLKAQGGKLLISANVLPQDLNGMLPDLRSRLMQALTFQVKQLSDPDKIKALQLRAQLWGWELSADVAQFMLHHLPRDLGALFQALDTLNKASLIQQRRITIPFVKTVLAL
jgi:DnaA family protein